MRLNAPEPSTVKVTGATQSILVWSGFDQPNSVSAAISSGISGATIGQKKSTHPFAADSTGTGKPLTSAGYDPHRPTLRKSTHSRVKRAQAGSRRCRNAYAILQTH